MESDTERVEEAPAHSRSQSPLPANVLQPEKDFILTFESITELWDSTHPQYTNKYRRNENLAKLLPILKKIKPNATLEDVKKKINTIRSNYRRELKKILTSKRSGAGTEEIYVPKIWYFPYLHFLRKLEQPVPIQQESEPTHQTQSTPGTNQQSTQQSREITQERSFSSISTVPKPSVSSAKKKKRIDHNELLDRACQYLSEPCTHTNLPNPIALEWSNTLDRLDPVQRLYAKKAINDILFEAELGNLNRYSVKINDTSSYPPTRTQNYSPYYHSSSPNNSTLTSPPPPPSPTSYQTLTSPTDLPSQSPQQTAPVIHTITQNYSPYPYSSSPNNSTLTSPPPPPLLASQKTLTSPTILNPQSPQQTAPVIHTIAQNYSPYPHSSSPNNSTLTSPLPPPLPASQQTLTSPTTLPSQSPQQTAPVIHTITQNYSPYPHSSSPNNSTLTSPLPPPLPASQQTLTSPTALPSHSTPQTAPVIHTSTQNNISYPHSFSPNDSTLRCHTQSSHKTSPQRQQTDLAIDTALENDFRTLQRGSASQIILRSNYSYDQQSQISAINSNEYTLSIPDSISSLFAQFKP